MTEDWKEFGLQRQGSGLVWLGQARYNARCCPVPTAA